MLHNRPPALREEVIKERHLDPAKSFEPACTRTQMVSYLVEGCEVARAHRYLRPDGTLGASGKPDPKLVFDGERIYVPCP